MGAIVTLTLALAATNIEGTVRLANGRPAESVLVAAIPREGGWWNVAGVARTDGDGSFSIEGLPAGHYSLTATSDLHPGGFIDHAPRRVELALAEGGRRISGVASHADGEPLHGRVLARRLSSFDGDLFVMETDARGRFTAVFPPARYRLFTEGADGKVEQTVDLRGRDAQVQLRLERVFHVTPPAVTSWIRRRAVPVTRLDSLIGDATIVAMGESTHGTHEFFRLRRELFEDLVRDKGFRILAIEADATGAAAVDDFILHGRGDAASAVAALGFWAWNSSEIVGLVQWMREYNRESRHTVKLRFYGFDMQHADAAAPSIDPAWHRELIRQGEHLLRVTARANEVRDRFMAENVRWILEQHPPGTKMVIWGHNGHVAAESPRLLAGESMGYHLRQMYGAQLRVIGFAFGQGRFRAEGGEYDAPPAKAASLDAALASAGLPQYAIDLRGGRGIVRRWLESPLEQRFIGTEPHISWSAIHPARSYDAIIFVRDTTPSHSMARPAGARQ